MAFRKACEGLEVFTVLDGLIQARYCTHAYGAALIITYLPLPLFLLRFQLHHDEQKFRASYANSLLQDSCRVRTYVHGTYYSLLSRKHFQDLAHECGLADMLSAGVILQFLP